jgi:cysteine desulfurase
MSSIYLDNNATTPVLPEVLQCMTDAWATGFANPGSQHSYGREARRILEDSRESLAEILNADASEVIFTSGGTESINMAIYGFTYGRTGTIAITAGEHPATLMACERARQNGWRIVTLPVDDQGRLDESQFPALPWSDIKLVCVILAHNETGVIQDVSPLARLCRQHGAALMLDAVQAVGKSPVDFQRLGATALAFGAHKFHGPRGIGGLLLKRGVKLPPFLEGGHQENGRRAGTEPVPLIAGMAKALQLCASDLQDRSDRIRTQRDQLQQELVTRCSPVAVHGANAERLVNTLSIAFPGIPGEAMLVNLHLAGVACSLGSTCASGSAEAAPSLLAMGLDPEVCKSSVRFSLGYQNSADEIAEAVNRIAAVVTRIRGGN